MNTVVLQTRDGNDITSASSPVKMKISNLDKSYIPVTRITKIQIKLILQHQINLDNNFLIMRGLS